MPHVELMKERVIVTGYYPDSPYKIGTILYCYDGEKKWYYIDYNNYTTWIPASEVEKSTTIFRKLNWHERRDASEMPQYLKDKLKGKIVIKVHEYLTGNLSDCFISEANKESRYVTSLAIFEPATKEDYENYTKTKE